ncbi:MAG: YqaJ viral recombinase family protein [Enterococcus sp.]|nr:YqaJ viral recombinase family protein [Enterococcus sp.]
MYEEIRIDVPDLSTLVQEKQALEQELDERIALLQPILEERNVLNVDFQFHLVEGSNAWSLGDRNMWAYHKKHREEVSKYLNPLRSKIETIKNGNAKLIEQINPLQEAIDKATGRYREYRLDTLGNATKTLTLPDNTPEWHEQRRKGIGGSDVGAILGVSPWNSRDDIFKIKTGQVQPEPQKSGSGALWRGSTWESRIASMYANNNPDKMLIHCKTSWVNNDRAHQFANLDGLLYDPETGELDTILEIKTSSTPLSWQDGVPKYYRMQVLWYMDAFGIKKGVVAVLIDDCDYREYEVIPRDGEMDRIHREVDKFVAEIEEYKQNPQRFMDEDHARIARLMPQ